MKGRSFYMRSFFILLALSLTTLAWGFNFTRHSVPRAELSTGSLPKDVILAIDNPKFMLAEKADYLAPDERVMGVVINGEARAYPIQILNGHEIANDEIRGRPIAVTW